MSSGLRSASSASVLVALAAATGCASLLGIDQPEVSNDAGGGSDDGSGSSSGSVGDDGSGSGGDGSNPPGDAAHENDATTANDEAAPPGETGTTDAHVTDTSTNDASNPLCPGHTGYILCDDFEEGAIDMTRWPNTGTSPSGATLVVDTQYAHSGTHALHVHIDDVPSGTTYDGLVANNGLSLPATVYARVWVRLPGVSDGSSLPAQNTNYLGILGPIGGGVFWGINIGSQGNNAALTDFGMPNAFTLSTTTIALNPWTCVTVAIATANGSSTGNISMTIGTANVSAMGVWTSPLTQFHAGAYVPGGPQPNFDVWLDDVYLSASPVSCNSP